VAGARWIDLLDPTREELVAAVPALDPEVLELLAEPAASGLSLRPLLESHGSYVYGVLVAAHPVPDEDEILYQQTDVVATPGLVVTVRKTPAGGRPFEPEVLAPAVAAGARAGELLHRLADSVAETYQQSVDAVYGEIDELEEHIDDWDSVRVRRRLSTLRRELLAIRSTVAATRAAVRRVVDGQLDIGDHALFPPEVEDRFADTYDTLVRVAEDLDIARELLASARDHHQATVAERQNDVVKKLAVIASLLLLPSLIVGFYGQNFEDAFSRPYWSLGVSGSLIAGSTIAQLAVFRWRRWI